MVPGMVSPTVTPEALAAADRAGERLLAGRVCHTGALIATLPINVQAALLQALTTDKARTADITKVLVAHGLPAKSENVARHRRRLTGGAYACKCPLLSEVSS